jgi:hypothetical protein
MPATRSPAGYATIAAIGVMSLGAAPASTLATLLGALAPGGLRGSATTITRSPMPAYMAALEAAQADADRIHDAYGPHLPAIGPGLPRLRPAQALRAYVTRFAPSPTGPLHLGHAYSAILAHDMARAAGGAFLLRIEDIDRARAARNGRR